MRCDSCGKTATIIGPNQDYAMCDECEARYQRAMATEFPFGQCYECGAPGIQRPDGTIHFLHVEGGCSRWNDD